MKNRIKEYFNSIKKIKKEYAIPFVHFLFTFLYERFVFIFHDNWNIFISDIRSESISNMAENVLVYLLSKIWAVIIIWILWKVIFGIIYKRIAKEVVGLFLFIYIIGVFVGLIIFPDSLGMSVDNYYTYAYAIRFLPTYWHSVFTGALYAGSMMVIPHPFSIFLFQWLAFNLTVAYIYSGINRFWTGRKYKFCVLLLYCLPETYYIVFNPYRSHYYTILCLFYFSHLFFAAKEKEKYNNLKSMSVIAILSSFIMVWRSEGLFVGVGGLLFALIFIFEFNIRKFIFTIVTFTFSFLCFYKIQGIGSEKYYGQDYMFINTLTPLYSILNDPNANLTYYGSEEDMEALESVVPIEILKQYGMQGFRNYNYMLGHEDFNQSLVDDETADNYMKAYYRIVLNNIDDYLDVQVNAFYRSLQIDYEHDTYSYSGDEYVELDNFVYDVWRYGYEALRETPLTFWLEENLMHKALNTTVSELITIFRELWTATWGGFLHAGAVIANMVILCLELILTIMERKREHLMWVVLFATIFCEMCVIVLFMPAGFPVYLYPVLYIEYILIYFYIINSLRTLQKDREV